MNLQQFNMRTVAKPEQLFFGGEVYTVATVASPHPYFYKVKIICKICGKDFFVKPYRIKRGQVKFCSRECYGKWQTENRKGKNSFYWKGGEVKRICKQCGEEFYVPVARVKIRYAKFCGNVCRYKYLKGKNHQNWQGGSKFWKKRDTSSLRYKIWRNKIFERDNYECYLCKDKSKKGHPAYLEVHHLKSWKNYPKLRYRLYNGITLCHECHLSNIKRGD